MGYLTIRLLGVYFTIATLALSVVVRTFITNWDYVGGSRRNLCDAAERGVLCSAAMWPISSSLWQSLRSPPSLIAPRDRALDIRTRSRSHSRR